MTAAVRSARYPHLDGLRAIAALSVVATHVGFFTGRAIDDGPFAPFLARMDFGVTVFFLLSGFLLYRPFVAAAAEGRRGPAWRQFAWRRALRIFPAYWLVIGVALATTDRSTPSAGDWAAFLTLTQTYSAHEIDPALTQMWTLAVEIAFYALLPLLAAVSLRGVRTARGLAARQAVLLGAMVAGAVTFTLVVKGGRLADEGRALLWLPAHLDWFAAGMALAVVSCLPAAARPVRVLHELADDPATCWVVAGLLFWVATLPLAGPRVLERYTTWEWMTKHWLYAAAALFLLLPAVLGDRSTGAVRSFLTLAPMRRLGQVSYGIYLWHLVIMYALIELLDLKLFLGNFRLLFPLTVLCTVAVATASYVLLERPLLSLGRSAWSGRGAGRSTSASTTEASATAEQT